MKAAKKLDQIDRHIIGILSHYEQLGILELWYELGETDSLEEHITKEELSIRLESLLTQGLVEQVKDSKGATNWCLRQGQTRLRRLGCA